MTGLISLINRSRPPAVQFFFFYFDVFSTFIHLRLQLMLGNIREKGSCHHLKYSSYK